MPTYTWDANFEAAPADSDAANLGANEIRQVKLAVSEREELEHNFKTGTQPFHKGGKCSILYVGNTADVAALANMGGDANNCTLAYDTQANAWKYYNGSSWTTVTIDHGGLGGLTDDDHTQYLKLDKANQTISANIAVSANKTIDGYDISVLGTNLANLEANVANQVFGAWATKAANTAYLANTDGFVTAFTKTSNEAIIGYTDSNASPTTARARARDVYPGNKGSFLMPVRKTDYWIVKDEDGAGTNVGTIYWLPWGV
jgi:hypothetical protein